MGRPLIDITGNEYGTLKVIKKTNNRNSKGQIIWECECLICGEKAYATSSDLNRGRREYCKDCRNNKAIMSPIKGLYGSYKRGAEKRGYIFELKFEEFIKLIKQDCYYCGSKPSQLFKKREAREGVIYNGIDRKDNSIGYTLNNVVPCCKFCNLAKSTYPAEELIEWIDKIKRNKE